MRLLEEKDILLYAIPAGMDILEAIILGIVQGITEWLPISSSGHLAMIQHIFGEEVPFVFDMMVHFATLLVLVGFFRSEIKDVILQFIAIVRDVLHKVPIGKAIRDTKRRMCVVIVIGTIPTGIIGLVIDHFIGDLYASLILIGVMLLSTGALLFFTTRVVAKRMIENVGLKDAVVVGIVQGLAAMPGLSRSGTTIGTGVLLGIEQETAGKYSFLLAIPAVAAGTLLHVNDVAGMSNSELLPLSVGFASAAIVGYLSLFLLMKVLKSGRIHIFAPYCLLAGALAITLACFGY